MSGLPELTGVQFSATDVDAFRIDKPLLVLGPSLGTSTVTLWGPCAGLLMERFHVIGWDLPGHGNSPAAKQFFDVPDLAASVLALVESVLTDRGERGGSFIYAGDSVGGAVGLQLLLDYPGRISAAAVICSGAQIGDPQSWMERAETVRANGTPSMVTGSASRWFAAGFVERRLSVASALLQALQDTERFSYAWVCEALAEFDVRDRLGEITVPVLAVAGSDDVVTPPEYAGEIASGVVNGRVSVIDGVAHLAPAESPAEIAALLAELAELAESGMPPQQPLAPVRSISPVAAPPTPGNFGTQNSGNFGTQNSGNFGTQNSGNFGTSNSGNFGTSNSGNFGPAPGTGSFPTSPPTGGFPAQPPTGGFPAQPPTGGFATSNPPGGYGTPSGPTSFGGQQPPSRTLDEVYDDGMRVRREVLGNAHVDRATASATEFTADFQEFITSYAWGSIWTRPGLDRRSRSMITLTALVALGHHEELAMHLRAARTNGLSTDEIKEVLMQSAIYCGVPAANTAFRIAQEVLNE